MFKNKRYKLSKSWPFHCNLYEDKDWDLYSAEYTILPNVHCPKSSRFKNWVEIFQFRLHGS